MDYRRTLADGRPCPVERQLAEQFALTARLYAEAVADLTQLISSSRYTREDVDRCCRAVAVAERRCQVERMKFEERLDFSLESSHEKIERPSSKKQDAEGGAAKKR